MAISDGKAASPKRDSGGVGLLLTALAVPGAIVVLLRLFAFEPFSIPSSSMAPTLVSGDYLVVSKIAYGYGPYSLAFAMPGLSGRIPSGWLPQRGDVVVFRVPGNAGFDFIKRIVGFPGERIQMTKGVLNINGAAVPRVRISDAVEPSTGQRASRYRETLPNGVSYMTLALNDNGFIANTQVYTVPADHYFVLGDNRDNSTDSRMLTQVGYVPSENLIGRAEVIAFSMDAQGIRGDRLFQAVH
jgi:signal peptidase I